MSASQRRTVTPTSGSATPIASGIPSIAPRPPGTAAGITASRSGPAASAPSFEEFGVPHYLKIDIEGRDRQCLEELAAIVPKGLPDFVSWENESGGLEQLEIVQRAWVHEIQTDRSIDVRGRQSTFLIDEFCRCRGVAGDSSVSSCAMAPPLFVVFSPHTSGQARSPIWAPVSNGRRGRVGRRPPGPLDDSS